MESMRGHPSLGQQRQQTQSRDIMYPYLNYLLPTSITIPMIDNASIELMDSLLALLPPSIVVLANGGSKADTKKGTTPADFEAAKASLSEGAKRNLLRKVLRSPQFNQALGGLTMALRDGGLPSISDALNIKVENGGYIAGGSMPMGGGVAVKSFVDGVKKTVQEKK